MTVALLIIKLLIFINVIIKFTFAQPTIIRCCHGSELVDNRLYVGGGVTGPVGGDVWTDDFFFLDLKKPFSTSSPDDMPYEVLTKVPVKTRTHALVYAKNPKGGMIYLFGGHRQPPEGNPIYGYSPEKNAWTPITPKVRDGVIIPVNSTNKIIGVTDSSLGVVYIFDNGTMFIYDATHNFWDTGKLAPFVVIRYTAIMLSTGEIAYIGGNNGTANIPMEQILIYNSKSSEWYIKTARSVGSEVPSPRVGHTASMALDGRIFIYGGFDGNENAIDSPGSIPTFAVLVYVDGGDFEWYSPQLFNQSSVMRIYHTSHVYENFLIVAFGRNLTHNRLNTIDLIDISSVDSYAVVTEFMPENYVPPTSSPISKSIDSSIKTVIIGSVFGAVGLMIIVGGLFFMVRCLQRPKAIPTPGGDDIRDVEMRDPEMRDPEMRDPEMRDPDLTSTSSIYERDRDSKHMPRYNYPIY